MLVSFCFVFFCFLFCMQMTVQFLLLKFVLLFGTMYNTVLRGQELGPHATLILYMNMKSCFPYGESFKLYIACTLWAAFQILLSTVEITMTIIKYNILMMKNYADEIIKILNKSYYIYNTPCFCLFIVFINCGRFFYFVP